MLGEKPVVERLRHAGHFLQLELVDLAVEDVHRRFRLGGHARLEARHHRQPPAGSGFAARVQVGVICAFIATGTIHVGALADDDAEETGGATPTMVIGSPLIEMVRLSTDGSPAKRRIQKLWLSTATGWPPGVRSSSGVKVRPMRADAKNIEVVAGDQLAIHPLGLAVREHRQRGGKRATTPSNTVFWSRKSR